MELPLFPLSAHLLPGGIMPLRIFEPRYQRLVTLASEHGFVLCMLDPAQPDALRNMLPIGTRVEIIDFDRLEDGLLGITVRGMERMKIGELRQEPDGLRWGEVTSLPTWPAQEGVEDGWLVEKLREVFGEYPEYGALYQHPRWHDINWVVQRWIEILPMSPQQKQWLIGEPNCIAALTLLEELVARPQ